MIYSLSLRRELSQASLVTANADRVNGLGELTTRAIRKFIECVPSLYLRRYMFSNSEAIYIRTLILVFALTTSLITYAVCYIIAACASAVQSSQDLYNAGS